ncbi:cinnamoyl-CoA reductase [Paraphoma chrysanthemicola]|nr:cinnamoyl-CoA reductase [Paraphoma chrysanthemicola]
MSSKSLVTGGSGFIGLYVVKALLENGHHVHTTVRSLKANAKTKPLRDLQAQHPGKLELGMNTCDTVYHVASPFLVPQQIKDGMKDCVEPALQGTRNVLNSVNETESVKRVVLTSSIVAMYGDSVEVPKMKDGKLSEDYWNETSTATNNPYSYSKVAAEKEAWKIYEAQTRWNLVVINPGLVIGPSLSPESASGSLYMLEAIYRGENKLGVAELHYPIVDVRDVATAHVRAGELTTAHGRHVIASDRSLSLLELANLVRPIHEQPKLLPNRNLPKLMVYAAGPFMGLTMKWVSNNIGVGFLVNNSKSITELQMEYRPLEKVLQDHYKSWLAQKDSK